MSDTTQKLKLPLIAAQQAQKHVTHNEALRTLDALVQATVKDRDLATPPATPQEGDCYIVAASATGDWAGQENAIAEFRNGGWIFHAPTEGWLAFVQDENAFLFFDGNAWQSFSATITALQNLLKLGVNTTADDTNRLAVKSDAVLFSHDDVTPGTGDVRFKVNKAAATNTASLLFQDNWAAHAEIGLVGSNDLSLKVSPDGSTWHDAFHVDAATGAVAFPNSPSDGNLLINGGFDIWQRGTAFSSVTNGYTADRWVLSGSGLWDVSRGLFATGQTAVPGSPSSYLHLLRQGAGATTLAQRIENPSTFSGKTLTLSFWARASVPVTVSARLWCHTAGGSADFEAGAAQPLGLSTTWQRHVVTFDVASFAGKTINDAAGAWLAVELTLDNVAMGASIDVAQVRLEKGRTASPFRHRPFDLELLLCQRYFAKSFPHDVPPGPVQLDIWAYMSVAWHAEHASSQAFLFPRPMRTVPTVTFYPSLDATAPVGKWHLLHGGFQECDASLSRIGPLGMAINVSKTGLGLTPGYGYIIYGFWTADAEL